MAAMIAPAPLFTLKPAALDAVFVVDGAAPVVDPPAPETAGVETVGEVTVGEAAPAEPEPDGAAAEEAPAAELAPAPLARVKERLSVVVGLAVAESPATAHSSFWRV